MAGMCDKRRKAKAAHELARTLTSLKEASTRPGGRMLPPAITDRKRAATRPGQRSPLRQSLKLSVVWYDVVDLRQVPLPPQRTTTSPPSAAPNDAHTSMSTDLFTLIRTAFPTEPLPGTFWIDGDAQAGGDIPHELAERLAQRPWTDVTLGDWLMTGHPSSVKCFLHPDAFRYYLPSLLVGVLDDTGYLDWALEALLPEGRRRRTDRPDWLQFWEGFSGTQRNAIRSYLKGVRAVLGEAADPVERYLFDELEAVWGQVG